MAAADVGAVTEVDAEALNSENVYWIDYRKDRHFIGSELRNGRFKVQQFVHASEVSSVGLVWEGRDKKKGNMRVAVKTPKAPATPSDWPSNWIKELKGLMTFSKLVHPNIMKVYGVYDEKCPTASGFGKAGQHIPYIILEHCPCTDLFSFLEARGALPMRLARHYFLQLMNGVEYIHEKSASHRDIKPDNIMLDKWLTLKIGDFGFARAGDQEKGFKSILVTKLGTPEYRAPDIYIDTPGANVGGTDHDPRAQDIWACGVTLFVLLCRCYPFGRKDSRRGCRQFFSMLDDAKEDAYPPTHKAYWNATDAYLMGNVTPGDMRAIIQSQETGSSGGGLACIDLLNRMWDCRTKRRISAKTVLAHPWMTECAQKPSVNEIEEEVKQYVSGQLKDPGNSTLLGQMFALKPGTDKMLMEVHNS
jgi:serine/threonine protein kinase